MAVHIDSATVFHVVWYSSTASGSPLLAGGLVWAARVFGGTTLYGLNPTTGAPTALLHLPRMTEHFATSASGDGKLFIGDGSDVEVFGPYRRSDAGHICIEHIAGSMRAPLDACPVSPEVGLTVLGVVGPGAIGVTLGGSVIL